MLLNMLKCKIHRATVKEANVDYIGSITIDVHLMEASSILEYEKVLVVDIDNGNRFETYVIPGERGSGIICVNGAAAHLVSEGDKIIIMAFCSLSPEEANEFKPRVVFVKEDNSINHVTHYEKHGKIEC